MMTRDKVEYTQIRTYYTIGKPTMDLIFKSFGGILFSRSDE